MAQITPQKMKPEAIKLTIGTVGKGWDYHASVTRVRDSYISWKTISEDMLWELWIAKQAITKGGKRKAGVPISGEKSWSVYVKECFGKKISKRSVDSYLKEYVKHGFKKVEKTKVVPINDPSRLEVRSAVIVGKRIKLDLYLPEAKTSYTQYIAA